MDQEKLRARAEEVFDICLSELDSRDWTYKSDKDDLTITFAVDGEDLPIYFRFFIDPDRQLITLSSPCILDATEHATELVVAIGQTNTFLLDGRFIIDNDGCIYYKMNCSYAGSLIGEDLFAYLIDHTCFTVDNFNEKLKALADGEINLGEYLKLIVKD